VLQFCCSANTMAAIDIKVAGVCGAVCCSVLQCVAVCCSVVQCSAVCCSSVAVFTQWQLSTL